MTSSGVSASALVDKLELPPLRTLDDFALGSARFQLPNLQDLDKWGNRVVKNLLYYQTNYFGLFLVIYILMIVINPTKIVCGLFVKTLLVAVFVQLFTDKGVKRSSKDPLKENRWVVLGGSLLGGYLLLLWFDAVLLSLFTILLPFCISFIHASLRLRNIKNKVANALESFHPASTPMGKFLMAMNIIVENSMFKD